MPKLEGHFLKNLKGCLMNLSEEVVKLLRICSARGYRGKKKTYPFQMLSCNARYIPHIDST